MLKMTHCCEFCLYSTDRIYNLKRHMNTRHKDELLEEHANVSNQHQSVTKQQVNVTDLHQNVTNQQAIVSQQQAIVTNENGMYKCNQCDKSFTRKYGLEQHLKICGMNPLQCSKCGEIFTYRQALHRHKQKCTVGTLVPVSAQQVANVINNNQNNNININNNIVVVCPTDLDPDFDFNMEHITKATIKSCAKAFRPGIGFGKFAGAILNEPSNRCIMKTNPNVAHSKIHLGNNEWEYALDKDIYPVITHHLTTAALSKINEFKESLRNIVDNFHKYVETVNTDEDSEEYQEAIQRLKLMIVNLSQKIVREDGIV